MQYESTLELKVSSHQIFSRIILESLMLTHSFLHPQIHVPL